jgi:hypothetical protein
MSLYDLWRAGVSVSNLDATQDNVAVVKETVEESEKEEAPVEEVKEETTEEVKTEEAPVEESEKEEEVPAEETEEVTVEETPEGEEVVQPEELETELLEVQEDLADVAEEEAQIDNVEEQIDEAEEAAVATEALIHNLLYTKKVGGGITPAHAELVHEHVKVIGKQLGWGKRDIPNLEYSSESFATVGAISLTQESIIQSAKDMLSKIVQSIIEGVNWVIQQGVAIWNKLFASFEKMANTARKLLDYANSKAGAELKEGREEITNASLLKAVGENGFLPTFATLEDVTKQMVQHWVPMKIQAKVDALIEGLSGATLGDVVKAAKAAAYNKAGAQAQAGSDVKLLPNKAASAADVDVEVINEAVEKGSFAFLTDSIKSIVEYAMDSLPFVKENTNKEELKLFGVELRQGEGVKSSPVLPGNRAIVLIHPSVKDWLKDISEIKLMNLGSAAKIFRAKDKYKATADATMENIASQIDGLPRLQYKMVKLDQIRDKRTSLKTPKMKELIVACESLIELCEQCGSLKRHLDGAAAYYKKVQRKLSMIKAGVAASTMFSGGYLQKAIRAILKWVRSSLIILREPGASYCSYMVKELSQLGALTRTGIESYEVKAA